MITITFKAFSFLQPKLACRCLADSSGGLELAKGTTIRELIAKAGLAENEIAAVFLNGRAVPWDRELHDGDRVALVPPGTPGPHPVLLGITNLPKARDRSRGGG